MKKIIFCVAGALILAGLITVVVLFAGNTPNTPGTTSGSGSSSSSESTSQSVQIDRPMISISLPMLSETDTADNGATIFLRTYQDVVLDLPNADIARTITLDLLRRMDVHSDILSSVQSKAFADYTGQEPWMPYHYKLLYNPTRIDEALLSLYGEENIYSSSVSGLTGTAVTYDLLTGTALRLLDVLSEEGDASQALLDALLDVLAEKKDELMLFDDYASIITSRFSTDLQQQSTWYFSQDGLCFFYSPYDIAPNSVGIVTVTVPYSALSGIVQDRYFPAEQASFPGDLTIHHFADAPADTLEHFSELILDHSGTQYLLTTDGVLYDLSVTAGHFIGSRFVADATVYHANFLSPQQGFVLKADLSQEEQTMLIRYYADGVAYQYYLQPGDAGAPALNPVA